MNSVLDAWTACSDDVERIYKTREGNLARALAKNASVVERRVLDATDLRILATLQESGRLSNVLLSEKTGQTPSPCFRRVKALEYRGYIRGAHAKLDPKKLGYDVSAFVLVRLKSQSRSDLNAFEDEVTHWTAVRQCHLVSRGADFLLHCFAKNIRDLQSFIRETLVTFPNVESVRTLPILKTVKDESAVPIDALAGGGEAVMRQHHVAKEAS